jgi:hypothetical protein
MVIDREEQHGLPGSRFYKKGIKPGDFDSAGDSGCNLFGCDLVLDCVAAHGSFSWTGLRS